MRLVCGVQNGRSDRVARSPSRILLLLLLYDIGNGLIYPAPAAPSSCFSKRRKSTRNAVEKRSAWERERGEEGGGRRGGRGREGRGKEGEREKMYRCERKKLHSVYIFT
jgi:hypothetical protein